MATIKRKKSALEEAQDFVKSSAGNILKGAGQVVNSAAQGAGSFYQAFSKGYDNWAKTQAAQQAQNRQNTLNITRNIVSGAGNIANQAQRSGQTFLDYFNATKDVNPNKPGNQNIWTDNPLGVPKLAEKVQLKVLRPSGVEDLVRRTPYGVKKIGPSLEAGAGNLLKTGSDLIENYPLIGGSANPLINLMPKQIRNPLGLPEVTVGDATGKRDLTFGIADKLAEDALQRDKSLDANMVQELRDLPTIEDRGGFWQNVQNPRWVASGIALNAPQLAATIGVGAALEFLTGGGATPALAGMAGFGYMQNAGQTYVEARRMGADKDTAHQAAKIVGFINGALDAVGAGEILDTSKIPGLRSLIVGEVIKDMGAEGSTEAVQQIISNKVAQVLYDKDRGLFDQVAESGFFGALGAGAAGTVTNVLTTPQTEAVSTGETPSERLATPASISDQEVLGASSSELPHPAITTPGVQEALSIITQSQSENLPPQVVQNALAVVRDAAAKIIGPEAARHADIATVLQTVQSEALKQPKTEFTSQTEGVADQISQEFQQNEGAQLLKNDMDKALSDTGQEMVSGEGVQTGPTAQDPFDTTVKAVEGQIRSMLSDDDLEVLGVKDGALVTPDGQPAWGKKTNSLIELVEQNGKVQSKTAYHEAFHLYADKHANQELYNAAIAEYVKDQALPKDKAVEKMADDFADFVAGRQGFSGQIQAFFHDLLINIRQFIGRVNNAEMLFYNAVHGVRGNEETIGQPALAFREVNGNLYGEVEQNLTTRILQQLQGKDIVPANEIRALLKQPGIRGLEQFLVETALKNTEVNGKVNVEAFSREVEKNLLPLKARAITPSYGPEDSPTAITDVRLPEAVRHPGAEYHEIIYDSPIENIAGGQHFGRHPEDMSKYFAHVRYEDLPDGTRMLLEIQSDLTQRGWLKHTVTGNRSDVMIEGIMDELSQKEGPITNGDIKKAIDTYGLDSAHSYIVQDMISILQKEIEGNPQEVSDQPERIAVLQKMLQELPKEPANKEQIGLEGYKNIDAVFKRLLQEEVRRAAQDGKTMLLVPTGDTILRIEDLKMSENEKAFDPLGNVITDKPLKEFASDASFKRVHDIYENELPKIAESIGKPTMRIVDDRGVSWRTIDITPEDATKPITAFRKKKASEQVQQPAEAISQPVSQEEGPSESGEPPSGTEFPRRPGELNVNRLDMGKRRKKALYEANKREGVEPLTEDEVRSFADRAGIDMKAIGAEKTKKIATEQYNTRRRVVELDNQIAQLKREKAPIEQIQKLLNERQKVSEISGMQGRSAAQILRMRAMMADEINTPMNTVFQSLEQLGVDPEKYLDKSATVDFSDPDQVIAFWRDVVPAKWTDWLDKVRYNAMLTSPNTHIVNIASNLEGTGILTPVDLTIQGAIDKVVAAVRQRERTRFAGEGIEYAKAYWPGQWQALKAAFEIFTRKNLLDLGNFNPRDVPLAKTTKGKVAEGILDFSGRLLAAEDASAKTAAQLGYEQALKYRQKRGIKIKNIEETASNMAKKSIFTSDVNPGGEGIILDATGAVAGLLQQATNSKYPFLKWPAKLSFPFVRIGTNLAKAGFESNPVTGTLNLIGNDDKISSVSKMIMGGAFTAAAVSLAMQGRLVGAEDKDKTKRDQARDAGIIPWSVRLSTPWGEQYVAFNKMHPVVAFQFGMVAAIMQAVDENKLNDDVAQTIMDSVARTTQFFNDQTYWKNIGDFTSVMRGDPYALSSLLSNYPAQLIPFRALMSWATRITDEYQRSPKQGENLLTGIMQRLMAGVPLLSTKVPAKEGPYGEPIEHPNRFFNLVSPYKTSPVNPEGMETYNLMKIRADVNKENKMRTDAEKENAPDMLTPEQKRAKKNLDLRKEINSGLLKKDAATGTTGAVGEVADNIYQWIDEKSGDTKTLDLNSVLKKKNGIASYEQDEDRFKAARDIHDAPLSDAEKEKAYKSLGVTKEEVRYDSLADHTNEVKTHYLVDKLSNQPHEVVIERLITGRMESVSGLIFASNGVLDNLVDEGIISKDEAKYLKNLEWDKKSGKFVAKGSGSGKKVDFSLDVRAPKTPTVSLRLPSLEGKANIKALGSRVLRQPETTRVKLAKPQLQQVAPTSKKGRVSLAVRPMAKTLAELGRA